MAVAGLVLGIVAIVLSFIPCVNLFGFLPAVLGLIFSIIGLSKSKKTGEGKGMSVAGLICSILALVWIPIYYFIFLAAAGATVGGFEEAMRKGLEEAAKAASKTPAVK